MNWHSQNITTLPSTLLILCCLVISLFASGTVGITNDVYRKNITCIDHERDALLEFKGNFDSDDCGLVASWGNLDTPDCCTWKGVTCSKSGHVIGIHLRGASAQFCYVDNPGFSPPLGELKHLKYLDLSSNDFFDMDIPSSITSLVNLVYLNLSGSFFSRIIPNELGNLTSLKSLDLSNNDGLFVNSLNWLSRLTSLRVLNLTGTDLSMAKDWFPVIKSLPLLEVLIMDSCKLPTPLPSTFLQSANLGVISLSGNNFSCSSSSFQWLFDSSNYSLLGDSLKSLDM